MKLKKYSSYEDYVSEQTELNILKEDNVFIIEEEISQICDYIKEHVERPDFGICHGVRNGYEVKELRKRLGFNIIGTEISSTANKYPNVIQWDFNEVKPEWVRNTDFIYSNSLDHSINPTLCVKAWLSCLKKDGVLIVCWSSAHVGPATGGDCFSATLEEYESLFKEYKIETKKVTAERCLIFVECK